MHFILLVLSALLLVTEAKTSPLSVLTDWSHFELLRLASIFIFLSLLSLLLKTFKSKNLVPASIIALIVLVQFSISALIAVIVLLLAAAVIGSWVIKKCTQSEAICPSHGLIMDVAVGCTILVGIFQVAVHYPINTPQIYTVLIFLILALLHKELKENLKIANDFLSNNYNLVWYKFSVPVGVALTILTFVALPETHSDALMVNLNIANQVQNNSIWSFNTLSEVWALWPKAAAWLHSSCYIFGGEKAARLFNFSFVILTAILICREAVRIGLGKYCWILFALFLSTPITFWCSFVMFDDAVFGFFVAATIIFTISVPRLFLPHQLFILALLASASIATKITGLFVLPVIVVIAGYRFLIAKDSNFSGLTSRSFLGYSLVFIPFVLIGFVAYIYSYVKTGNPVFPLYNDIFKSGGFPSTRFEDLRWSEPLGLNGVYKMTANTSLYSEGKNWLFGIQFGLFFLPVLYELIGRRKSANIILYFISSLCFSYFVFSQIHYVRYLFPVIPFYCLLVILAIEKLDSGHIVFRSLVKTLLVISVFINILNVKSLNMYYHFDFLGFSKADNRSFVDYNEKQLNAYVNVDYGSSAVVLYLHRPYNANLNGTGLKYHWTSPVIKSGIDEIKNISDLRGFIVKHHITHVIWDTDLFATNPLEIYKLLPQLAVIQKHSASVELWKVGVLPVISHDTLHMSDKSLGDMLVSGWLAQEAWGVWSKGDSATFLIRVLPNEIDNSLHVNINLMPYAPTGRADNLILKIYANKTLIQELNLAPIQEFKRIDFDIPKNSITNENIIVEFSFSKPFDSSLLQFGFSEMNFEYR